jgi:hypothetical protein
MDAAFASDGVHRNDVGMVQVSRGLGFVPESLEMFGVQRRGERQYFDRDSASERQLFRFVDDSHSTAADLMNETEVADWLADRGIRYRERLCLRSGRLNELKSIQAIFERLVQFGVARRPSLARGAFASFNGLQVLVDCGKQLRIVQILVGGGADSRYAH